MNTKLLKQKILDLAIRGKITQQLKSDGNTADLLKEIADAKSTLSQPRGKKSKDLGQIIPLDKNEAPFEIPANWEWVRLGDIARVTTGKTPLKTEKKFYDEGTIPWVTSSLTSYDYIDKVNVLITEYAVNQCSLLVYPPGTLVLAMYGEGKTRGQISELMVSATINQACAAIEIFCKEKVFKQFIKYFHNWNYERIREGASGSTQPNLNLNIVQSMMVPLPPLAEQQRIVEKIQEAFAEIDSIENNKELLKTHIKQARQKILDLAIHGKLVPQNKSDEPASVLLERITRDNPHYEKIEDEPFEIPENWAWVRINDINFFQSNTENPMLEGNKNRTYELYSVPCFEAKYPEIVKGTEIGSTKVLVNKGDVLISKINPHLNRVWCVPQFTEHRMIASSEWIIIRNPEINQSYLVYVLQSGYFLDKMLSNTSGVGGSLTRAKPYEVKKYEIPLPPLAEQSRIVAKVEELFSALDQMERNLI